MVAFKELGNIGAVAVLGGKEDNWVSWKYVEFQEQRRGPLDMSDGSNT